MPKREGAGEKKREKKREKKGQAKAVPQTTPESEAVSDPEESVFGLVETITFTPPVTSEYVNLIMSDSNNQPSKGNNVMSESKTLTFAVSETEGAKIVPQSAGKTHQNFLIIALVPTALILAAQEESGGSYTLPDGFSEKCRYKNEQSLITYDAVVYSEDKAKKIANTLIPGSFAVEIPGEVNAATGRVKLSDADLACRRYCTVLIAGGMSEADARNRSGWTGEIPAPRKPRAKSDAATDAVEASGEVSEPTDVAADEGNESEESDGDTQI